MAHSYYPVALDLVGKRCLVVGGGSIATDKVDGLLNSGAQIVVVSPQVTPRIRQLAEDERITLRLREYGPDDLDGVYLAYGATDDRATNARVSGDGRERGILVNAVDDIPYCDFFAMAITRRGDLQVAVSTNGHSPALARWVREYLDESLPTELGDLLAILAQVRREVKTEGPIPPYERWNEAISEEVLLRLRHGDRVGAREKILETLVERPRGAFQIAGSVAPSNVAR